ncbi:MAG: PorT family protein [Chitinophagaceae bacterium]|nr:PorT family protein [Chitinophagaceae bacterium]
MKYLALLITSLFFLTPLLLKAQEEKKDSTTFLGGRGKIIFTEKDGKKKAMGVHLGSKSKDSSRHTLETYWFGFDMGFNQYTDETNYDPASVIRMPNRDRDFINQRTDDDFDLRSGKSMHFNFTIVKQQLSLYKHYVSLMYGITYDINNWRYKESIRWEMTSPIDSTGMDTYDGPAIFKDSFSYKKNKLVTNYLQVPVLLRFETSPRDDDRNVCISLGGFAGYLVRAHTKQIRSGSDQKEKEFEDFNLNKFQMGLQAEIGYSGVSLYFKRNLTPLTEYGTEQYPYCFGIRLLGQ